MTKTDYETRLGARIAAARRELAELEAAEAREKQNPEPSTLHGALEAAYEGLARDHDNRWGSLLGPFEPNEEYEQALKLRDRDPAMFERVWGCPGGFSLAIYEDARAEHRRHQKGDRS